LHTLFRLFSRRSAAEELQMPGRKLLIGAGLGAALALAGCDRGAERAEQSRKEADPALTSALEDQILVDPALTQQSNRNAVRPPETPPQAQYPLEQGGEGAPKPSADDFASIGATETACGAKFDHGLQWADRLPPEFAALPGAQVTEAAGVDRGECRARVVTYSSEAPPERVLGWYEARLAAAGYSAERQQRDGDRILAGSHPGHGGAYFLVLTPRRGGGSDIALIVSRRG